jgi:protein ImuA
MRARPNMLAALRGRIERLETPGETHALNRVALGHAGADAALRGGLATGAMHEVFSEGRQSGTATGLVCGTVEPAPSAGLGAPGFLRD